ncbi:MAG: hypothetical protein JF591_02570 [Lysobacter sp.]|nr:hypothetical protein [Lysobacter sp.]
MRIPKPSRKSGNYLKPENFCGRGFSPDAFLSACDEPQTDFSISSDRKASGLKPLPQQPQPRYSADVFFAVTVTVTVTVAMLD